MLSRGFRRVVQLGYRATWAQGDRLRQNILHRPQKSQQLLKNLIVVPKVETTELSRNY